MLAEAGHKTSEGHSDGYKLIESGPTIIAWITHFNATDSQTQDLPAESVSALIDTGAGHSCIDNQIATRLGLPVVDMQTISGANGAHEHPVYMAHISFPALNFSQYGRFTGVDLLAGGQPHGALLGRTFLSNVIMIYDGLRAQVTLASQHIP